ncbi:Outer membrane protein (porin) [Ferrimonas sediminum]|uniref:Outer membrane protein (Porin) n=1 Tax=Ferrimonas sediminum TaxID=718193 RepID=A0A1G8RFX5_9GAMM|nr:porin [Ferrimonas sediminum]SDJ15821.1 Outer membrane protein (porin) [Ferrimonas sediminum]
MKKSLLAVAVPALLAAQAQAVELYNDGVNSVSMGGHLTIQLDDKSGDAQINDNMPRINLAFDRDLGNGYKLDSKVESALNMDSSGETFTNRLGYIGVSHEDYGRVSAGKQWSTYYDVAVVTDYPYSFWADHLGVYSFGKDGGESGLGRADKALQYHNTLSLGDAGDLTLGLQWQGANGGLDDRMGGSLVYAVGQFTLGAAYYGGDVDGTFDASSSVQLADGESIEATIVSASYGTWGKGFYGAVAYMQGDNVEAGYRFEGESEGLESIISYGFENSAKIYTSYRFVKSDEVIAELGRKFDEQDLVTGIAYSLTSNVETFGEYRLGLGDDNDDNAFAIGIRYYL